MIFCGAFPLELSLFCSRLSWKFDIPKPQLRTCHKGWLFPTYQRDTGAGRTQLEPLVAKQLLTLISFSTDSRRAANSELLKKIAASLTGFKPSSFTLLPAPDENHYPIELTSGPLEVCQIILTRQLKKNTQPATTRSSSSAGEESLSVVL